jgi:hypothetical protein
MQAEYSSDTWYTYQTTRCGRSADDTMNIFMLSTTAVAFLVLPLHAKYLANILFRRCNNWYSNVPIIQFTLFAFYSLCLSFLSFFAPNILLSSSFSEPSIYVIMFWEWQAGVHTRTESKWNYAIFFLYVCKKKTFWAGVVIIESRAQWSAP